ncbi:MAG: HNH endonuclease [Caldiserica bacterium]|jgi:hypothetical protein|nr:HNH endonuclease [Caldisericota bacterium]
MEVEERFWSMVKRDNPYSCWEWQGYTLRDGYGAFHFQGKRIIASRFAWILTYGEIPPGMCVLHKCDNPSCVNPRHLFLGTQKDNMHDAVLKGMKSGPHNGRTRLTWPQVDAIRLLLQNGWSAYRLARFFGVNYKTVWQILRGKTWREPAEVMDVEAFKGKSEKAGEVMGKGAFKEEPGEAAESFQKEEFEMKRKGMWLVTERVETPALTLEFPVGMFCSREAALAFVRGKEKAYRLRWISSDIGEANYCEVAEVSSDGAGEAEENFKKEEF